MKEPICKIADIIYVRFELEEFEAQKKYLNHFGMILAHENENSIFFRGTGISPYIYVATKGNENKYIGSAYKANNYSDLEAYLMNLMLILLKIKILVEGIKLLLLILTVLKLRFVMEWYLQNLLRLFQKY
jgi:hypothetical protein